VDEAKAQRLGGIAGIAFSVLSLIVIPLALPPPPPLGASAAETAVYFAAHRMPFLVGNYLGIAAFVPGFVQLAIFAARVRRLEGPNGWLSGFALASGTFTYAVFGCSLVVFQILPFLTADAGMFAFHTFANVWFALDGLAALPFVLALGWVAKETTALPRSFVPFSAVIGIFLLVMSLGSFSATPEWLAGGGPATAIGFVGFFAWTFVWSIAMIRSKP
jgi:hypothetical protein